MLLLYASTLPVCLYNVGAKCKQYQLILFVSIDWLNTQQIVEQLIIDQSLDVLALTETWYSATDDGPLVYSGQFRTSTVLHYSSLLICGCRVAFIRRRKRIKCRRMSLPICETFDAI